MSSSYTSTKNRRKLPIQECKGEITTNTLKLNRNKVIKSHFIHLISFLTSLPARPAAITCIFKNNPPSNMPCQQLKKRDRLDHKLQNVLAPCYVTKQQKTVIKQKICELIELLFFFKTLYFLFFLESSLFNFKKFTPRKANETDYYFLGST